MLSLATQSIIVAKCVDKILAKLRYFTECTDLLKPRKFGGNIFSRTSVPQMFLAGSGLADYGIVDENFVFDSVLEFPCFSQRSR